MDTETQEPPTPQRRKAPGFGQLQVIAGAQELGDDSVRRVLPLVAIGSFAASPFLVSVLATGPMLVSLVAQFFSGDVADNQPARRTMLVANGFRAVVAIFLTGLFFAAQGNAHWILWTAMVLAVADAFYSSAHQVFVNRAVPDGEMTWFSGRLMTVQTVCGFAAPLVGGALLEFSGHTAAMLAIAVAYTVSTVVVFFLPSGFDSSLDGDVAPNLGDVTGATEASPVKDWVATRTAGLRLIFADSHLRAWVLSSVAVNCASMVGTALVGLYAIRELGIGAELIAAVGAVGMAGALLASLVTAKLTRWMSGGSVRVLGTAIAGVGAAFIPVCGPSWGIWAFGVADFLWSLGVGIAMLSLAAVLRMYAPGTSIGKVGAAFGITVMGSMTLAGLLAGAAAQSGADLRLLMFIKPVLAVVSIFVVLWSPLRRWSENTAAG